MAETEVSDSLAKWTFIITMIATLIYSLSVYFFVLDAEVPDLASSPTAAKR